MATTLSTNTSTTTTATSSLAALPDFVEACRQDTAHAYYGTSHYAQPRLSSASASASPYASKSAAEPAALTLSLSTPSAPSQAPLPSSPSPSPPPPTATAALSRALSAGDLATLERLLQPLLQPPTTTDAADAADAAAATTMLDINERLVAGSAIAPLHVAAARGFDAAVRLLLAVPGVVVDIRDAETETPLFKAALRGHAGTVQLLLAGGADAQACDAHGWTALHNAASQGHLDVVRQIADAGVSVNAASTAGFTPLMNAAARGQIRVAEFLLGAGADPTLANGSRDTAHDVALYHEHYHLARMLDQAEQQWYATHPTAPRAQHQAHVDELYENQRGGSALFPAQLMAAVPGNFTFTAASLVSGSDPSPLTNSLGLASGFRHVPLPGVVDPATGRSVPQWFWLTEWRLDTTDPRLADAGGGVRDVGDDQDGGSARSEGWLYAKSFDMPADAWRSTLVANDTPAASSTVTGFVSSLFGGPAASASASGSGWVRRRRWVRVRKRRADYDRIAALAGGPVPAAAPPTASAPASAPAPAAADATRTQVADLHTDLDALKRQIENLLAASAMETDRERKKELSAQIKSLLDRAEETETLIETLESHDIVESRK